LKLLTPIRKAVGMSRRSHAENPPAGSNSFYHGVPFTAQSHVNLCGDACANMLIRFYNNASNVDLTQSKSNPAAMKMMTNPRGMFSGSGPNEWARELAGAGLSPYSFFSHNPQFNSKQLYYILSDCGPFIAGVAFNRFTEHAILVNGMIYDDALTDKLYYHDPWRGSHMSMTLAAFNTICKASDSNSFLTVAQNPINPNDYVSDGLYVVAKTA
jgi:hypothetical protein